MSIATNLQNDPPFSSFPNEETKSVFSILGPPSFPGFTGRIGKYELIMQIGVGGMGIAYSGIDITSPVPATIALKLLKAQYVHSSQAREYFRKEALHMQILSHRNILSLIEFHDVDTGPYIVMPYIPQGSLRNFLKRKPSLARIVTVLKQVASALTFAHQRGVFHCDVKPSNILIDSNDQSYLMDFGLARSHFSNPLISARGIPIEGTPQYQSPGIAAGEHEDSRADVYSFGAVMYEILTGQPPYPDGKPDDILQMICAAPPPPILSLNPSAYPPLVAICEQAMARSLRARYAHMLYCYEDLEQIILEQEAPAVIG